MNIIFMGTPDFAVGTLEALIDAGHTIELVVTQPDKPKGRGNAMAYSPVKEAALAHGIEVYQPRRIRDAESVAFLNQYRPDVIVVVAFGQILPKEILDLPKYCPVNVHASLLPKYRGAAPIQWAVINGEKTSGVTTMRMDEGLDTGDMILREEVTLAPDETGGSLFDRLAEVGAKLCVKTVAALADGSATFTPQDHTQATHTTIIKKGQGELDFSRPAKQLEQLVRGLDPWPSAFTYLDGRMLKIWRAEVAEDAKAAEELRISEEDLKAYAPGTVCGTTKKAIGIRTGEGVLWVTELQAEGKKRMETSAYLLGAKVAAGTVLGKKNAW